ncbi:MAG TPA: penicillin acylase family protein [Cyclobacteriaceae bacterium]|nr:penicillin acylase family protein [Cyclobacteriaceae bacterium]
MIRCLLCFVLLAAISCSTDKEALKLAGLQQSVEILRDSSGINHIYAQNEHDLFFAQGYSAAKDRLFQFELWRRQASGTVAEILGEQELKRDIGTRLFMYRGDLKKELNHYHPRGEAIITAFTEGINAYITETKKDSTLLPIEFKLLGITPQFWTPELVVSRHQGLLGNLPEELNHGRAVARVGEDKLKDLRVFEPGTPRLTLDKKIDSDGLFENILEVYDAFRKPIAFKPENVVIAANLNQTSFKKLAQADEAAYAEMIDADIRSIGSNNWIVGGAKTETGFPMLANDPHRALAVPSLRYMVHLNAPGWNVVGGGEPTIPGISIGHNEYGAWGLTIFDIDSEDLYVYDLNPENLNQYQYKGEWEEMKIIADTIRVKNSADVYVQHKFTRHGPVTFVDTKRNKAYGVRAAWMEPGGAPYMASLRMNGATTWEEFREACSSSHIPGENMIWADKKGNIGWQTVGIAPIRKNWDGLVPVPGDGSYEWEGYLPIKELPNVFNPQQGYWVTANENLVASDYNHRYAVGWEWADSSRANRLNAVLQSKDKVSFETMQQLQFDYFSNPARQLVPYLKDISIADPEVQKLQQLLLSWDFVMDKNSLAAGVYAAWEKQMLTKAYAQFVPENAKAYIKTVSIKKVSNWLKANRPELGGRTKFLTTTLELANKALQQKLGLDTTKWQYGQTAYHHVLIKHPLSNAVNDSVRAILECGPLPRGGSGSTPAVTGNGDNQSHGATFRMVADVTDWNKTHFTNSPGQSGDPASPFYRNLFESWATDKHFTVYFDRNKVEASAISKILLQPK